MQKVVGSSPISRFEEDPLRRVFWLVAGYRLSAAIARIWLAASSAATLYASAKVG
jgi:hypothetical protein